MWRQNAEEEEDNSDDDAPRTRSYVGYSMPAEPAATVPALIGGGVDTVGGAGTVEIAVHETSPIGPILLAASSVDPLVSQPAKQQLEAAMTSNLVCRPSRCARARARATLPEPARTSPSGPTRASPLAPCCSRRTRCSASCAG
jgi:hypothetical protein